jgi:hypothetical protein
MNGGNLLLTSELVRDLDNLLEDEDKCSIDLILFRLLYHVVSYIPD